MAYRTESTLGVTENFCVRDMRDTSRVAALPWKFCRIKAKVLEYYVTLINRRKPEETRRPTTCCTTDLTDGFLNWTNLFGVVVSHPPSDVFRVVPSFQNSSPDARQAWIIFGFHQIVKARKLRILKSF